MSNPLDTWVAMQFWFSWQGPWQYRQCFQSLVDEGDVVLIDVEAEKTQFARCRSANAVKEHGCLGDQIVAVFIGLGPQKVLQVSIVIFIQQLQKAEDGQHHENLGL